MTPAWSFKSRHCQPNTCDFFRNTTPCFYKLLTSLHFCSGNNHCPQEIMHCKLAHSILSRVSGKQQVSGLLTCLRKQWLCLSRVLSGTYQPQTRNSVFSYICEISRFESHMQPLSHSSCQSCKPQKYTLKSHSYLTNPDLILTLLSWSIFLKSLGYTDIMFSSFSPQNKMMRNSELAIDTGGSVKVSAFGWHNGQLCFSCHLQAQCKTWHFIARQNQAINYNGSG